MSRVFSLKILLVAMIALTLSPILYAAELEVAENAGIKGIVGVFVDDLENDQQKELIAYTRDYVYALEKDASVRWSYQVRNIRSVHVSDIDSDGYKEVLVSSGEVFNQIERGNLHIIDRHGKTMKRYVYELGKYYPQYIYNEMATTDLDDDRYKEIITACAGGVFAIRDTFEMLRWGFKTNEPVLGVRFINSTGNKSSPILANTFFSLYGLALNGTLVREYRIDEGIVEVRIADIYSDPGEEVLLLSDKEKIHVLSNDLEVKIKKTGANGIRQIEALDLDNDGLKEFAVAADREVQVLDNRLNIYGRYRVDGTVNGLFASEWDGEGEKEVVFSSGKNIYWINKHGEEQGRYTTDKEISRLLVDDLDEDNYVEVIAFTEEKIYIIENNALKIKDSAKEYYAEALGFMASGKYLSANRSLAKARELYGEIGDEKSLNLCRDLEDEIYSLSLEQGVKGAESYCEAAASYFELGDMGKTLENLEKAGEAYLALNASVKSTKCDDVYLKISQKEEEESLKTTSTTVIKTRDEINILQVLNILLLGLLVIGLIVFVTKRK